VIIFTVKDSAMDDSNSSGLTKNNWSKSSVRAQGTRPTSQWTVELEYITRTVTKGSLAMMPFVGVFSALPCVLAV
jgi:hypothetical protein